jgi:hypothetical protein
LSPIHRHPDDGDMIVLTSVPCPVDGVGVQFLDAVSARCPCCKRVFVVTLSDADYCGTWNRDAPGYDLIMAVMAASNYRNQRGVAG